MDQSLDRSGAKLENGTDSRSEAKLDKGADSRESTDSLERSGQSLGRASAKRKMQRKAKPEELGILRRRVAQLEDMNKVLDQTISLTNKKHARDVRRLKRRHRAELANYLPPE